MSLRRPALLRPSSSMLGAIIGVCIGIAVGAVRAPSDAEARADSTYELMELFADVFGRIQDSYVEPVDDEALMYAAINGMLDSLDPHSRFMDAEAFAAMREDTRGEYVGVGMQIIDGDAGVAVGEVFAGGPAADAGLRTDDVIISIGGLDVQDWTSDDVVSALRGPRGEAVALMIRRDDQELAFDIVRDIIHLVAVESSLPLPGYGVVTIRSFQTDTGREVRSAIDRLQAENGGALEGLVLDLRGNPGGLLSEAVSVSDAFLADGTIVSTAGRDPDEAESWEAQRSTTRYRGPLVVLVDGMSASASEVVAGALQDHGRAVVVGTQSYGKGSVQSIIELTGGAGMKLTIARYYTPDGRSIQNVGITPDVHVEAGQYAGETTVPREATLAGTLDNPNDAQHNAYDLSGVTDLQMRAARQQLRAFAIFNTAADD